MKVLLLFLWMMAMAGSAYTTSPLFPVIKDNEYGTKISLTVPGFLLRAGIQYNNICSRDLRGIRN